MRDPSQSILVLLICTGLAYGRLCIDLKDTPYINDKMCATTVLREMKYGKKLFSSVVLSYSYVVLLHWPQQLEVWWCPICPVRPRALGLLVPDDDDADGEELALPARRRWQSPASYPQPQN